MRFEVYGLRNRDNGGQSASRNRSIALPLLSPVKGRGEGVLSSAPLTPRAYFSPARANKLKN